MKFKITRVPIHGVPRSRWYLEDPEFSEKDCLDGEKIVGEVELDIKPVKKWVKKEFKCVEANFWTQYGEFARGIPSNARNIKITYEVEE